MPFRLVSDPAADDGEGALIVGEADGWPEVVDRALSTGRPLITGPPPESFGAAIAALRDALGAVRALSPTGRNAWFEWRHDQSIEKNLGAKPPTDPQLDKAVEVLRTALSSDTRTP